MNGNNLFLDTNIILYLLSGDETIAALLDNKQIYISFITELELLSYREISKSEKEKIKNFINECIVIDINAAIKNHCINVKQKYSLKLPDCIIAGTALFIGLPFITSDKNFKNIEELNLVLYNK
jgi:predicted nucleic acid-binding protein